MQFAIPTVFMTPEHPSSRFPAKRPHPWKNHGKHPDRQEGHAVEGTHTEEPPPVSDLASVERIRAAALHLFAAQGVAATPLRAIAAEARVTVGLIPHHFGSKTGLRDELERWIARQFVDAMQRANEKKGGAGANAADRQVAVRELVDEYPDIRDYMRRELLHPFPGGRLLVLLTQMATESVDDMRERGLVSTDRDRSDQILLTMVRQLGSLFVQPLVDQVIDALPDGERPAVTPDLLVDMRYPGDPPAHG